MENTCIKEKCKIWQLLDGCCPNYIETWWTPPPTTPGPPVLIEDCASRRALIMLQELSNRLVAVQASQEELRNETVWVQAIAEVIGRNVGINIGDFVEARNQVVKTKLLTKGN